MEKIVKKENDSYQVRSMAGQFVRSDRKCASRQVQYSRINIVMVHAIN